MRSSAASAIATDLLSRWVRDVEWAVGGGLVFGTMSTVWLNATETEVYSASLLLSMLMLWAGANARRAERSVHDGVAGDPSSR